MWKKKYTKALPLASLDRSKGGNYVIQNAGFPDTDRMVITLQEGNRLGIDVWHNEFAGEKMFNIEPCADEAEDCVISAYGCTSKQWIVETVEGNNGDTDVTTLETKPYPIVTDESDERLRPPMRRWRFGFEEISPQGSKKYRIVSRDDHLNCEGNNCLKIGDANEKGVRQLEFVRRNDDDQTQLWCLHLR